MSERVSTTSVTALPGRYASLYLALAPVLAVFFLIPLELYTNAAQYWRWNMSFPLRFMAAGSIFYLALLLVLALLGSFSGRLRGRIALVLFFTGLFLLLADVLAPLQTGLLDGTALESEEPLFYTLIELAILVFVLFLAVKLGGNVTRVAVLMTTFLLITSVFYTLYAASLRPPEHQGPTAPEATGELRGNVYHILLDEMQSDVAQAHLATGELGDLFEGFRFYPNNVANYLFTNVSMPSYLTGKLYKSGDFLAWQDSYKSEGLFRRMYDAGYEVQLYSVYDHWCSPYARRCVSLDQVFEQQTGLLGADFITFIQIWFARISPNAVTNRALATGKALGNSVDARLGDAEQGIPKTIARGRAPYSSILMLDELIEKEEQEDATGRYVYAHTIIPHGPYVMNEDCQYDAEMWKREGGKKAYYQQARCSIDKVGEFLKELKRLGRYDDATIVVQADTGHGHMGFLDFDSRGELMDTGKSNSPVMELDDKFRKTQEWYLSRSMALLMLKPPGAAGEMVTSEALTQLTDVYPAVLEMAGLPLEDAENIDGCSPLGESTCKGRAAPLFFTTPARPGDVRVLTISDQRDIRHSSLSIDERAAVAQADRYSLVLGLDEGVELQGFSYPEHSSDGTSHWRWVMATRASVDLSRQLKLGPGSYTLEMDIEPFGNNRGTLAAISVGDQRMTVQLEPGWQRYQLQFTIEQDTAAVVSLEFEQAESPMALGMSADTRPLAARVGRLDIRPDPD